jgi:hypothetical protein
MSITAETVREMFNHRLIYSEWVAKLDRHVSAQIQA